MKVTATWLGTFPLPYPHVGTQVLKVYQTDIDTFYVEYRNGELDKLTTLQVNKLITNRLVD